jgi:multiple sugar transport system ATP-binding protein
VIRGRFSLDFHGLRFNTVRMAQVGLEHLTKVFEGPGGQSTRAVDDACLVVEDKELLALVGPSGCGKTTTLRLIAGLEEPTAGAITMNGQGVNDLPPKDRDVAMVFQHYALYPHMSVYENMAFGLKLRHFPRAEIAQRVTDTAQILDLTACLDRKPAALSGGQRQRVALGRALVRRPGVFLLDEPLSNLDAQSRLQMRAEISRLQARLGSTIVYVTHDQGEAMALGHRVAVMNNGRLQQVAAPLEIYQRPANLFVAGFIGSPPMNLFDGMLVGKGDALIFEEGTSNGEAGPNQIAVRLDDTFVRLLRAYEGKRVVFGVRPEDITCGPIAPVTGAEGMVERVVELVQPLGPQTYLHLAGQDHAFVARVGATDRFSVNQKVRVAFDARQAHFFEPKSGRAIV